MGCGISFLHNFSSFMVEVSGQWMSGRLHYISSSILEGQVVGSCTIEVGVESIAATIRAQFLGLYVLLFGLVQRGFQQCSVLILYLKQGSGRVLVVLLLAKEFSPDLAHNGAQDCLLVCSISDCFCRYRRAIQCSIQCPKGTYQCSIVGSYRMLLCMLLGPIVGLIACLSGGIGVVVRAKVGTKYQH